MGINEKTCEKCGHLRSTVLRTCGGCVMLKWGMKPNGPVPLSPEEQVLAEKFLGRINGSRRAKRRAAPGGK